MKHIYLDYNATTPIAPEVQHALAPYLANHFGNPSSGHALGRAAAAAIEQARRQAAGALGALPEEIVFTSGGSEANNAAIKGVVFARLGQRAAARPAHLVVSAIEHPAVAEPARFLERLGHELTVVGCDARGVVDPRAVAAALRPNTALVSVMHANNETGVAQPIREIVAQCRARGVPVHCDAAQTFGKIPVNVAELGVDLLSLAGHKFYAPKGVGLLYARRGVALEPLVHGAGHESGLRAGTENTPYIVALGRAALWVTEDLEQHAQRLAGLRDQLETALRRVLGDKLVVFGRGAHRLPNTACLSFLGVSGREMLARAPELLASTGAACHSLHEGGMSATLRAMGATPAQATGMMRLSLGRFTTEEEVERAVNLLLEAYEALA